MIVLSHVTLRRGALSLLEETSLTLFPGWRVGVVGRNGTGKSSLFAALLGELTLDAGALQLPGSWRIATVAQETPALPELAIEYVLDGDTELREVERGLQEAEAAQDADALTRLHDRMHAIGGYAARARAARLLHGLGFAPEQQLQPVAAFSGGWRMRLNLARALMRRADLLLLDEPTNHLDLDAVLWLQDWLRQFSGTLLVISHDREFLDAITTHTLHLEQQTARLYTGGYSQFERQRAERLALQSAAHAQQQQRIAELEDFIRRFKAKATKARQAQSRVKALERMEQVAPAHWDAPFSFRFPAPERLPSPLVRLDGVSAGYPDRPVLHGLRLLLAPGQRIGLLGANGAGKSTLVRTLAGELAPLAGQMLRDPQLRVGYFAQHQLEQLDPAASPLLHLRRLDPQVPEQALRDFLGGFNFRGERQNDPVGPFSGGEKARLALALVVYQRPNLLLLDEPTNHLDLDMRHALELALQDYAGAMVLVSHDRHLLTATCDEFWRVAAGGCAPFDGDLDDYARWLLQSSGEPRPASAAGSAPSSQELRRRAAEQRAREKPLRDALRALETRMTRLQAQLKATEERLADPALYSADSGELPRLLQDQGSLRKLLEEVETQWLDTAEQLERGVDS